MSTSQPTDLTEEELLLLEERGILFPGIIDPKTLNRLIQEIRRLREELIRTQMALLSLKDEATLRDERDTQAALAYAFERELAIITIERDTYRNKLAQVLVSNGRFRPRKRRR